MGSFAKEIEKIRIEDELRQSYLDYSMSVIVSRALPDVRDGLKPVHRRILHAMRELSNSWDKPYKKSARVVGNVIGKYHPHGEGAVYTSIVRMAQNFAMRYTLVEGQGNFGSIDGDAPAAMRYTEIRMQRITEELLEDMDKETVDFVPNYDNTETIPEVLPARIPNLLINGSSGIAVGLATNIPPHNLSEVLKASLSLLKNPKISVKELMKDIPGPDFPTGAIINGRNGIADAYRTGRGRVLMRACAEIVKMKNGRMAIIVTELPYQVNKAHLVERIAALVRDKKLGGISELRDESDKDGIRVVVELRRGEVAMVVLNNLYAQTPLESSFSINMVALSQQRPRLFDLKGMLEAFLAHRREVVTRRTLFLLRKARTRAHLLEGLSIAVDSIDEVVMLIRNSATAEVARESLMKRKWPPGKDLSKLLKISDRDLFKPVDLSDAYGAHSQGGKWHYCLSPEQAKAILELRLQRLTALEQDKIREEYQELSDKIRQYVDILSGDNRLRAVLKQELESLLKEFGDERRTELRDTVVELSKEDLIPDEGRIVTLTHGGYINSQSPDTYRSQKRGGVGSAMSSVKEDDALQQIMSVRTHDTLLCFSSWGKVYWLRVYNIATAGRNARGRPLVNMLRLSEGENINAVLPVKSYDDEHYIMMSTQRGLVKRTVLSAFSRHKSNGLRAIVLGMGDRLVSAKLVGDEGSLMLLSNQGKCVHFAVSAIRVSGRASKGVTGMRLGEKDEVVAALVPKDGTMLCTVTQKGYGKCTKMDEFAVKGRGGKGMIAQQITERNGALIGALQVLHDSDELMLISNQGTAVRMAAKEISVLSRATKGNRLMRLREGEEFVSMTRIAPKNQAPDQ